MTPSLIRSTMSRLSKDVTIKKFDAMIKAIEKGNPGDRWNINRIQKRKEEHIFREYPELREKNK